MIDQEHRKSFAERNWRLLVLAASVALLAAAMGVNLSIKIDRPDTQVTIEVGPSLTHPSSVH
ncbi:MAG: hypothetical protein AAFQ36_05155 [Pseudomonadota bacterium]